MNKNRYDEKKAKWIWVKKLRTFERLKIMATSHLMSCNFMILTTHKNIPFDDRWCAQVLKNNKRRTNKINTWGNPLGQMHWCFIGSNRRKGKRKAKSWRWRIQFNSIELNKCYVNSFVVVYWQMKTSKIIRLKIQE